MSLQSELNRFRNTVTTYIESFKSAVMYTVALRGAVVQACILFLPYPAEHRNEVILEMAAYELRIYRARLDVVDVFNLLDEFSKSGNFRTADFSASFVDPPSELSHVLVRRGDRVRVHGREWLSWVLETYGPKSLDQSMTGYDFSQLYRALKDEKGVSNLTELMRNITGLAGYCDVDSSKSGSVYVIAPIYSRIKRGGVADHKARIFLESSQAIQSAEDFYLNLLLYSPEGMPIWKKVPLPHMKFIRRLEYGLACYAHEEDKANLTRIEAEVKDLCGNSWSSQSFNALLPQEYRQVTERLPRRTMHFLRLLRQVSFKILAAFLIALFGYAAYYYFDSYFTRHLLPDPPAILTGALALGTLLMAYMTKRSVDVALLGTQRPLAQEALDEYLTPLEQSIKSFLQDVQADRTGLVLPSAVTPAPHIAKMMYEEHSHLFQTIRRLLKDIVIYNSSAEEVFRIRIENTATHVIKHIEDAISALSKKYGVEPSSRRGFV